MAITPPLPSPTPATYPPPTPAQALLIVQPRVHLRLIRPMQIASLSHAPPMHSVTFSPSAQHAPQCRSAFRMNLESLLQFRLDLLKRPRLIPARRRPRVPMHRVASTAPAIPHPMPSPLVANPSESAPPPIDGLASAAPPRRRIQHLCQAQQSSGVVASPPSPQSVLNPRIYPHAPPPTPSYPHPREVRHELNHPGRCGTRRVCASSYPDAAPRATCKNRSGRPPAPQNVLHKPQAVRNGAQPPVILVRHRRNVASVKIILRMMQIREPPFTGAIMKFNVSAARSCP